jgi:hypothetical protein
MELTKNSGVRIQEPEYFQNQDKKMMDEYSNHIKVLFNSDF